MKLCYKYLILFFLLLFLSTEIKAQENVSQADDIYYSEEYENNCEDFYIPSDSPYEGNRIKQIWNNVKIWSKTNHVADGLQASIDIGSMGIGLEINTTVTKWVNLRAGIDWIPQFKSPLSFNLNTYSDGIPTGNFNHVADILYETTGISIDETVHMTGKGHMFNFKLIADIFPVQKNRHWYFSVGFFAGTSMIAKAINTYGEKPTLVGLNIYNHAYQYFTNLESIYDVPLGGGAYMNPELVEKIRDKLSAYGRMGVHIGDFKNGTPYIMEPAPDGTVSAKAFVNHFKPYLGAGYTTNIDKEGKWNVGIDLGVLFWGGVPDVINHDYTTGKDINFSKDLINIRGKVGKYIDTFKKFPVYPVLALRFSYTIL
ncbi:MAG: hypothetical protein J1F12_06845 [Muribaculaceae bacterium]|nr:hypothetical protein [Muribaculaceae bacterium]